MRRFCLVLLLALAGATPLRAQERPLLMEGTHSLYQRVLTRPEAPLLAAPEGAVVRTYPAFQPLYVFERRPGWLRVGPSANAPSAGWMAEARAVPWKQNIVAAFTNPAGRERQFVFASREDLDGLLNNEALRARQTEMLAEAAAGTLNPASGVLAIEPEEFVDIRQRFYLMPILDFAEELHPLNYEKMLLLRVASVPLHAPDPSGTPSGGTPGEFDSGIVFVLDTTMSMGPYIERTRAAIEKIVNEIKGTDVGAKVSFGVVGFRDNAERVPGLEYRTKVLAPLERRDDQAPVLAALGDATNTATVSTPGGFNEDSMAGVEDAIDDTDWTQAANGDPFDGRYVILITDAGPKDPHDPDTRSAIGPAELQAEAEDKGVAVLTMHLETPAGGEAQHEYAAGAYRALSRYGQNEFYFPIADGSEAALEATVTSVVTQLTDHIRIARGEAAVAEEPDSPMAELGLAMRLAYLGQRDGTQAPEVIDGWISEKAVEDPAKIAVEPRLLVTKNELATLADLLEGLETAAETSRGEGGSAAFFRQMRDVIARIAQNPDRLVDAQASTLGGSVEFLEGLPYRSQLLQIDEETWGRSAMNRRAIQDGLRQKLVQYRKWLYDASVWTALYEGQPDGEQVLAMPFDILP